MGQEEQVTTQSTETIIENPTVTTNEQQTQSGTETIEENTQELQQENIQATDTEKTETTVTQPVSEEVETLKAKLKEYELQDAELNQLKQRLGIDNVDYGTAQLAQTSDIIRNTAQQEYIKLCNEYGVDYIPEKLDASAKLLQERDPKAFYEFQLKLDRLYGTTQSKLQEVQHYTVQRDVNSFWNDNKLLLDASPVLNAIMSEYVSNTAPQYINRQVLDGYMDRAKQIYAEAFQAGMQAGQSKAQLDPNKILNSSTITQQSTTYPMEGSSHVFTRQEIANMSLDEFAKHEKAIQAQMIAGKIR